MSKDEEKNIINRSHDNMIHSENSYPTTASPEYPNTVEAGENGIKSNFMKMIDVFKDELKKSFNEMQENTLKPIEVFKDETNPLMICRKIQLNR